ncbi:MAG TPA: helix-turn-helix transcriptional regulator [Candidatus Limnocylindrales bacterium]
MDLNRFGRAIRALRRRRHWRQSDLADAAHVSASQVGRVERGESRRLPVESLERVALALGASLDLTIRWKGEGLDRLLDEAHARLVELVVRNLRAMGWDVAVEVSFSIRGERGSIDVLAFHPGSRLLVVIEVKSVTPDMQAMLFGLDRKGRLAPAIARDRGWFPTVTVRLLVLADTRTNRRRLDAHAATVRAALPAGTREVLRWLRDPRVQPRPGVWFVSDRRGMDANDRARERVAVRRASSPTKHVQPAVSSPRDGPSSRTR